MSKFCTDIEQSKKLKELKVDLNTANFAWYSSHAKDGYSLRILNPMYPLEIIGEEHDEIPAWSLDALLGLMPKLYEFGNDPNDGGCQPNLCKGWDNNKWHIIYRPSIYITKWYDDPLDAAFDMVCWLKENGKI